MLRYIQNHDEQLKMLATLMRQLGWVYGHQAYHHSHIRVIYVEWQGERYEGNGKCTTFPFFQNYFPKKKMLYKIWNNLFQYYHLSTALPVCLFVVL